MLLLQVRDWIYSEQAELMRLFLERDAKSTDWLLDYKQLLFHPNFWFTASWDTRVLKDGRIHNKYTASTPAFIHYNGDSKRTWHGEYSPQALARALRRSAPSAKLERLDTYLRDEVAFLGLTFVRDTSVTFRDVCSRGSISGE